MFDLEPRPGALGPASGGAFVRGQVRLHIIYKVTQKAIKSLLPVGQILSKITKIHEKQIHF